MIFSYNWLKDYIKGKLPEPVKLAELLTLHSFEVSELKKAGREWILDIDVLPDRAPDCFSHLGIAREIAAITNCRFQPPENSFQESKELKAKDFISVEVRDKKACPRYTARTITDIKVGPSPRWLQERLEACGLRPINNIVDIANYVMLETGQPLHAFDGEKLQDRKIIVRFAKDREKIVTLDEEKYDLDKDVLVIADAKKPIAIAGIKGGIIPEITRDTKTVVLESANFNPRVIRQGSKKIDLKTDASLRFEHGIDHNLSGFAINRLAYLIKKIAGGKIAAGFIDIRSKRVFPRIIQLNLNQTRTLLGLKVPEREIKAILERLGFGVRKARKRNQVRVEVPTFRLDVSFPEDLIEEIGRIYGYEKIPTVFPVASLIPPQRNLDIFWEDMTKNTLKEAGLTEVYNYSFISEGGARILKSTKGLIELENPASIEQKYLRPSLIPNLLENLEKNLKNFDKVEIFELGKIYRQRERGIKTEERKMLTALISGDSFNRSAEIASQFNRSAEIASQFYRAKGIVDSLLNKLGISNVWYDEHRPSPQESQISIWHPKKCAEIKANNEEIGFLGEISPRIIEELKINNKAVIFDIDFENLARLASEEQEYRPISRYPAAVRDLAVLVPYNVRVEGVLNKIEAAGGSLIRDIDLFDIYEGEELPEGKKNLAFHIIYQSEERTLSSKEIDEVQNKIIKTLEKDPEWQVRK